MDQAGSASPRHSGRPHRPPVIGGHLGGLRSGRFGSGSTRSGPGLEVGSPVLPLAIRSEGDRDDACARPAGQGRPVHARDHRRHSRAKEFIVPAAGVPRFGVYDRV